MKALLTIAAFLGAAAIAACSISPSDRQGQIKSIDQMIAINQAQLEGSSGYVQGLLQTKINELRKVRSTLQAQGGGGSND